MNKAFDRMTRRVNKMIYYNQDCFCKLQPLELQVLERVLGVLYQDYLEHKDVKEYSGMKAKIFREKATIGEKSLKAIIWMLIPQFVNIQTKGEGKTVARKYKLNANGIELVERLMNPPTPKEKEQIDEEEEDESLSDNQ